MQPIGEKGGYDDVVLWFHVALTCNC
jgi:hypothetical protein